MRTASAVPAIEIWIVSMTGTAMRRRKSADRSGGNAPRANRHTFARASAETSTARSTWAARRLQASESPKRSQKAYGKTALSAVADWAADAARRRYTVDTGAPRVLADPLA
jgi:hypothetical protein